MPVENKIETIKKKEIPIRAKSYNLQFTNESSDRKCDRTLSEISEIPSSSSKGEKSTPSPSPIEKMEDPVIFFTIEKTKKVGIHKNLKNDDFWVSGDISDMMSILKNYGGNWSNTNKAFLFPKEMKYAVVLYLSDKV